MNNNININDLILDKKNQDVLMKKLYNKKMSRTEVKRLHRTIQIIKVSHKKIKNNNMRANKDLW